MFQLDTTIQSKKCSFCSYILFEISMQNICCKSQMLYHPNLLHIIYLFVFSGIYYGFHEYYLYTLKYLNPNYNSQLHWFSFTCLNNKSLLFYPSQYFQEGKYANVLYFCFQSLNIIENPILQEA